MPAGRPSTGSEEIRDLVALLEYYHALGIERLPLSTEWKETAGARPAAAAMPARPASGAVEVKAGPSVPRASAAEKASLLVALREEIGDCTRCKLSIQRTHIVFGEGNPDARLMFIGEGPGEEEDLQARPFVGNAGILLTRLIEKMELRREDVYIANVVKCRPPGNRDPEAEEIATCKPFLERQIEVIRPSVIMTLGRIALQSLLNNARLRINAARGHFFDYSGIPVMPTFHPAYLLRSPADKWKTWADAQKALERMRSGRA